MTEDTDLKNKAEALLFAAGKRIALSEVAKLCKVRDPELVRSALATLRAEYDARQSPTMVVEEGVFWKLTVREKYLSLVKRLIPEPEMPKTVMETLAIIAWKSPALQSEIVDLRTNKAYDHIEDLTARGFIVKERHGRSYLLRLTQKFFDYFDIKDEDEVKKKFERFKERALKRAEDKVNAPASVPEVQQQNEVPAPENPQAHQP